MPIAEHQLIKSFFAAKKKTEVKIPKEHQMSTWDISTMVNYIKKQLSHSTTLSLQQLQLKTILLLCIATMWRPHLDITCLQYRDIFIQKDKDIISARIYARTPKESQVKSTTITQYLKDSEICLVSTLFLFITSTATLRTALSEDHTLFLTYLDTSDKQSTSVRPTTVANWIKTTMTKAGINTEHYQAHSFKAASSTKAVERGHAIQDVKKHANWSLSSNTFENYYKFSTRVLTSSSINNSIFSGMENSITLGVGLESTGISLSTTSNPTVDGTKTNNATHTRLWYRRFF